MDRSDSDARETATDERIDVRIDVEDEVLVEEVSIDGMCGVY